MATKQLPLIGGHANGFGHTHRTDTWWVGPLVTLVGFTGFIVYVTWAMFQGNHYYVAPYLSPLYSPLICVDPTAAGAAPLEHAWFGAFPSWWPSFLPASPAFFVLVFPATFRFTCYYYRKAYYRAYVASPPACAVGPIAPGRKYNGETAFLIFQNLHRYALYFALLYIPILYIDAIQGLYKHGELGIGVGTVVLFVNATLIAAYTFGCHSFRHLIGGHDDCMSCGKQTFKYGAWKRASWFNARHQAFAWASLLFVMFTDVYLRLVSSGAIRDLNTWN
jgi:hypothetical protein